MVKPRGKAQRFAEWDEKVVKDHDPEADVPDESSEESESDADANKKAETDHYETVGKSKLRRKQLIALGPQYRGSRVSREDLENSAEEEEDEEVNGEEPDDEDEEESGLFEDARENLDESEVFDDPDEADLERDTLENDEDAEIDSDNALGESDVEKFKGFTFRGSSLALPVKGKRIERPSAADFMEDEAEESDFDSDGNPREVVNDDGNEDDEEDDEDEDEEMDDFIDDGEEEEDEEEESVEVDDENQDGRVEEEEDDDDDDDDDDESDGDRPKKSLPANVNDYKALVKAERAHVTGGLARGIQQDVLKGVAVRQQRKAFDAALNIRIRLQKALIAVNTLDIVEESEDQREPYEAAEEAAIKLWDAIDSFRSSMQGRSGQKRKHDIELSTPSQGIWDVMEETEQRAAVRRKAVLENWSSKAKKMRTISDGRSERKLGKTEQSLTTMLENQVEHPERLVKRTQTPRSCAPAQVASKITEDPGIYDDADFYQLLLKELVDQRSGDSSGVGGQAATIKYSAVKEAKTKKKVDTKASKGRKMRFNVHEKLQNFMAPEDRRSWEEHAVDRLFSTLFGQQMALDEGGSEDDDEADGIDAEEQGLRLFRS